MVLKTPKQQTHKEELRVKMVIFQYSQSSLKIKVKLDTMQTLYGQKFMRKKQEGLEALAVR